MTFDEMIPEPAQIPIVDSVVCSASTGFRFDSAHFHVIGPDFQAFTISGSTYLGYESGRGFPIVMSREGTGTFSLLSLDAAEFFSPNQEDFPNAEWVTLTGHQAGGGVVTHSFNLDGLHDGAGGINDFEHFVLPSTFVNLRSVVFTGWRTGGIAGGLAFDDLEYQMDSPETIPPCTFVDTHPIVSIVSPNQAVVSGLVTIDATATDNVGVANVVFKLDGVPLGAPMTSAPYVMQWDTTSVADGPHTIRVEARDAGNVLGTASINVVVQNNVVVSPGPHYVSLDGVDDYAFIGDGPALSFGTGTADTPFTIEMWVRPDTLEGRRQLIGKAGEYRVSFILGSAFVELWDNSAQARTNVYTLGVDLSGLVGGWHHLAFTYDGRGGATAGNGITIYLDGSPLPVWRENSAAYVAMENLDALVEIGRQSAQSNQYDGGLDELRVWNLLRSASQIQFAMGAELTGLEAGLVGYWRFNEGGGLSVDDDSPNVQTAALMNGMAWLPDGPLAPDATAPQISAIAVSNVTSSGATITFSTDEPAIVWVSYAQGACPCTDAYSAGSGTSHTIQLTGLAAATVYQFTVSARDGANNLQTSTSMNFQTLVQSIDVQPPTVTFVTPAAGSVAGTVTVEALASDNVGVTSVGFFVDGVALGAPDTTAPYSVQWDSTTVADGAHTLTAEARDSSNNINSVSVVVQVQNTPLCTLA